MTPEEEDTVRAKQRSRAKMTAILLVCMGLLFYLITIVKLGFFA